MAVEVNIPKLGMSMKEATLTEWKFNEGDKVNAGDVVLVIETDKTTWEVESPASGYLHTIVAVDNTEPVGAVVGKIAETPEELAAMQKESGTPATAAPAKAAAAPSEAREAQAAASGERLKVSPVAKKNGRGTGP